MARHLPGRRRALQTWALGLALAASASAQTTPAPTAPRDTTMKTVVVTAMRTAQALEDVAVPTTVVSVQAAQADGDLRLSDAIETIPGVQLTSDFGTGVQIQGLDPEYTLILIDGQPVVGRTAGVLNLDRLSLRGFDRVEVVKGPSSSLYGSDALAGVINLVTQAPQQTGAAFQVRAGSFGSRTVAVETDLARDAWSARLALDRTSTDGYDLDPTLQGDTGAATTESTGDLRLAGRLGNAVRLSLGARATMGEDRLEYAFADINGAVSPIDERGERRDWSLHPELRTAWGGRYALRATGYLSGFRLDTRVFEPGAAGADSLTYDDRFDQRLAKVEAQLDALWSAQHRTTVGAGGWRDALDGGTRYGADAPRARNVFGFAQHDWEPSRRLSVNASARLDVFQDVATRLSPKLAALVRPTETTRVRLSVGSGFKAPDFRQLYLQFSNGVGGYTLFGAARLGEGLDRLQAQGRYQPVAAGGEVATLRPETSLAVNAEAEGVVLGVEVSLGAFRNAVRDLIDSQPVALLAGGEPVYSYVNLDRIRTEGLTVGVGGGWRGWRADAGYQWLRTRDLDLLDDIRSGTVFAREDGRDTRLAAGDYGNLFGRSTHSGTARLSRQQGAWSGSLRSRWRSRYGLRDFDGNGLATRDDEFVPATVLFDATLGRSLPIAGLAGPLQLQLGVDNLFGTTRANLVPTLAGRRVYASVGLSL